MESSVDVKPIRINQSKRKYLKERLSTAYSVKRWRYRDTTPPEPAKVKAARKVVRAYEEMLSRRRNVYEKAIDKAKAKAYEVILFGSPLRALGAVIEFEDLKVQP